MRVSLLIISFNRASELQDAVASGRGRGFDEVVVLDNGSSPPLPPIDGTIWVRSEVNLGATGGRNEIVKHSTGDILVFLDDDAVLRSPSDVEHIRESFSADEGLAVVAGLVRREGGEVVDFEFPFRKVSDVDRPRPAPYFLEGLVAIRRTAWEHAGGYHVELFYAHEAIDLAIRLMKTNWGIRYDPELAIEHRPSSSGRETSGEVFGRRLGNRIVYARRHLPLPIAVVHVSIWIVHIGFAAGIRNWAALLRAVKVAATQRTERSPITWHQAVAFHRRGSRIFW